MIKSPLHQWIDHARRILLPPTEPSDVWQEYRLARHLGLSTRELADVRLGPRYHYRPFKIQKPDGRERRILAPSPALKKLHRQLLTNYLSTRPIHPAAAAFFPGASIAGNARRHTGQALIATVDLADFFETTSANRVRAFFVKDGWRGESLSTLMRVCVYRGGLPQGAPTSPCLSNLVNVELDDAVSEIARRAGARYTRY
ncbi:MAG TPA: reverse transcriptase family protein, partial [Anaerolineales bacterium]|nr:reverse transcriptase family protein [Anaerolineales bacterium]